MNKIYIVVIGIVLIAGGWYALQGSKEVSEEIEQEAPEVLSILSMLMESSETESVALLEVEGRVGSGIAYRSFEDGEFLHAVAASMPLPAEGSVYEGWLVKPSPLEFFSTGVMQQDEHGDWVLEYRADVDYPEYGKVVITEETLVDETPEAHVLEGDF